MNATALPTPMHAPTRLRGPRTARSPLFWLLFGGATVALLALVFALQLAAQPLAAMGLALLGGLALWVYGSGRSLAWAYLLPGVMGMLVFIGLPLAVTTAIGFTNYSSAHLLTEARARAYLLDQRELDPARLRAFTLHREADGALRLALPATADGGAALLSAPLGGVAAAGTAALALTPGALTTPALDLRAVIAERARLVPLRLALPDGTVLSYVGPREFGAVDPVWTAGPDGSLVRAATGEVFTPNREAGVFEHAASGERMPPGFRVGIGGRHYARMLFDADFRAPFVAIFAWTLAFATLTVLFTTAIGVALAVALNWPALRGRTVYRTLLFLPYAVPAFISILVFKGLFNPNFGEINAILDAVIGVRPAWFADPWLAKAMLLVVNTWLGYPYVMVLATGLIQAIPKDLYEASAIAGAGPWANFRRITAPLIVKPLMPLLISAFAFNFNNFVLIALLTEGRPDFIGTKLPAGTNDLLVSYTYRIAFTDSGQNFGLAAAISTLIFIVVALIGLVQLRLSRAAGQALRHEEARA